MSFTKLFLVLCLLPLSAKASAADSAVSIARTNHGSPSNISELLSGMRTYAAQGLLRDDKFFSGDNVQHFLGGTLGAWTDLLQANGEMSKWAPILHFEGLANDPDMPCQVIVGRAWVMFYGEQQVNSLSLTFDAACKIQLNDIEQWFGKGWKRRTPLPSLHPGPGRTQDDGGIEFQLTPTATMSFMFKRSGLISAGFKEIHPRDAQR